MKKIFIDGGAHTGESIDLFRKLYQDHEQYEIHSFEPNPDMWPILEQKNVILHKEGLWSVDCTKDFFTGKHSESSTFLLDKVSGKIDYNHPVKTKCIGLGKWIVDNFSKDDFIILKLDVEGAEYEILNNLIETGVIEYVDILYGELHSTGYDGRIRSLPGGLKQAMFKRLEDMGIKFNDWHNNRVRK